MHQSAAACGDVHDQRPVGGRVIAIRRGRFVVEKSLGMLAIAGVVLEQPDGDDLVRIAFEEVALKMLDGPFHGSMANGFDFIGRTVAHDDERALTNTQKPAGNVFLRAATCSE